MRLFLLTRKRRQVGYRETCLEKREDKYFKLGGGGGGKIGWEAWY